MTNLLFDKKDVFTVLNASEAEAYEGEEGYFADSLEDLQNFVKENITRKLYFIARTHSEYQNNAALFLPASKVKRTRKKYRPYTLEEFYNIFPVGSLITFHQKDSDYRGVWLFTGYATGSNLAGKDSLYLGAHVFNLQELFDDYQWIDKNENWHCFGIEE